MESGSREYLEKCLPTAFDNEIEEFCEIPPSKIYSKDELDVISTRNGPEFLSQLTTFKAKIRSNFKNKEEAEAWLEESWGDVTRLTRSLLSTL